MVRPFRLSPEQCQRGTVLRQMTRVFSETTRAQQHKDQLFLEEKKNLSVLTKSVGKKDAWKRSHAQRVCPQLHDTAGLSNVDLNQQCGRGCG